MSNNKVVSQVNYSPIWESSCRPLFIKSVWLDSGHRHFLLDYKPKHKSGKCFIHQNKDELNKLSVSTTVPLLEKDFFLIGLSKIQCQQSMILSKGNCRKFSSRNTIINQFRWKHSIFEEEPITNNTSLFDIDSSLCSNINPDEKLADRVLNWLDLAGRALINKPLQEVLQQKSNKKNKIVPDAFKFAESICQKKKDSIKHITIIFNKQGVPIRFTRPARNVDLCAITTTAGAVRRLGSSRLYEENAKTKKRDMETFQCISDITKTANVPKSYNEEEINNAKLSKENSLMRDVKRQLHIFMPSLPKKY